MLRRSSMSDTEMATELDFLGLPNEVLQNILQRCSGEDLAALSHSCHTIRDFVADNELLWKYVYLRSYDGPPITPPDGRVLWNNEVHDIIKLEKLLAGKATALKRRELSFVCSVAVKLIRSARGDYKDSSNVRLLQRVLEDAANQNIFCCSSSLFQDAGPEGSEPASNEADRQLSAQLHCLYGAPRWGWEPSKAEADHDLPGRAYTHPYARARVYDLRRYTQDTFWGPFKDDGSAAVDWEKMEAIITVLGYNLKIFSDRSNGVLEPIWREAEPFKGAWPHSYRAESFTNGPVKQLDTALQDPYGVTGTWHRIVCFLDYYDFFAFNFRNVDPPDDQDRDPLEQDEAIRLILMQFEIDKIEPPGEGDGQDLPVVHFKGVSRAMPAGLGDPNANSEIRGTVRQTLDGEIRWTTYSVYSGESRWKSEGIQLGGIGSGRGVIGNWFDKDFDPRGPAGPTAFWKVNDEAPPQHNVGRAPFTPWM